MAVGAFATYNVELRVPGSPLLLSMSLGGATWRRWSAVLFGLPSLRIKGFYLLVVDARRAVLCDVGADPLRLVLQQQRFGRHQAPRLDDSAAWTSSSPVGRYLLTLGVVVSLFWLGQNLVRSETGA